MAPYDLAPMEVGLSVASQIGGLTGRDLVAAIDERVRVAQLAGLDSLHVGDKHGTTAAYAANFALAGRISANWPRRLGVLVVSTFWNPVLLAEQIATLAASTQHLEVVVGLGDGPHHFASVGLSATGRLERFLDGLAVTRALVAGETVTTRVGGLELVKARVQIGANTDMSWLLAASARVAVERAATLADGWLASAKLTEAGALDAIGWYRSAGGTGKAAVRRDVYVGESTQEVAEIAEPLVQAGHRGYPPDAPIRGDEATVLSALATLAAAGFDEVLVRSLLLSDQARSLASLRRLARLREATAG